MPPQPSLVHEEDRADPRKYSSASVPRSATSEAFLTQSTLDQQPIVMDEITVRKCPNYRVCCNLDFAHVRSMLLFCRPPMYPKLGY